MHRQRFSVVRRFILSNRPILSDAFIAMTTTFYDVLLIFCTEHHKSILYKEDILRKEIEFYCPATLPFWGLLSAWCVDTFNRMFLSEARFNRWSWASERSWSPRPPCGEHWGLFWFEGRNRHHVASLRLAIAHLMSPSDNSFVTLKRWTCPGLPLPRPLFLRAYELSLNWLEPPSHHSTDTATGLIVAALEEKNSPKVRESLVASNASMRILTHTRYFCRDLRLNTFGRIAYYMKFLGFYTRPQQFSSRDNWRA